MSKIEIDRKRCKGCGMCVLFCPVKHLRMSTDLNDQGHTVPEMVDENPCTGCGICFRMCPDTAIEVFRQKPAPAGKDEQNNPDK